MYRYIKIRSNKMIDDATYNVLVSISESLERIAEYLEGIDSTLSMRGDPHG